MDKALPTDLPDEEVETIKAAIEEYLARMQRANEQMVRDQEEIEKLRDETRQILAREWKAA